MSASKQKKVRNEIRSSGTDKKAAAAAEKNIKDRKFRRNTIIVVVAVVILAALALVINSSLLYTKTTAITIGDTSYTPAEYGYYYKTTANNIYSSYQSTYGDMVSLFLDMSRPLNQQQYDADRTWADYVHEQTVSSMTQMTALYNDAVKNGYTLTEDDQTQIDNAVAQLSYYAALNSYPSVNAFLAANYSKGLDEATFRELATRSTLAYSYAEHVNNSFEYSDEQLKAEYAENADDYDYYSYYAYSINSAGEAFADLDESERETAAHEAAAKIAEATTAEEFQDACRDFGGEATNVTMSTAQGGNMRSGGAVYLDWMIDPARAEGDTTVIDSEGYSYALFFVERNDNNYNTVNTRHILIEAEADENGEYTYEALDAAKAEAERIYALWQEDPTEEHFAELATEYSEDSASNANGGLYEQVYKDQFVTEYNDFLFNSGSAVGDSAVVYGSSSSYSGYHVVYYASDNSLAADIIAEGMLRNEDYTKFIDELVADYTATESFGMKFAKND